MPITTPQTCGSPPATPNGTRVVIPQEVNAVGSRIGYACLYPTVDIDTGIHLASVCGSDGTWSDVNVSECHGLGSKLSEDGYNCNEVPNNSTYPCELDENNLCATFRYILTNFLSTQI